MDIFKHLKENKEALIAEKKYTIKKADSVSVNYTSQSNEIIKAESNNRLSLSLVINTTNLLDSHGDVHINGIWNKSLKELKRVYLLQEHEMKFNKIITDKVKASVKTLSWSELGYNDLPGVTQALVFDCELEPTRNPYMYDQYAKGYVNNHSVGMQYTQIALCINSNDEYYKEEKQGWDKYINQVANSSKAFEQGYFWAVTEAKLIEGSAVPIGSNFATPVLSIKQNIEAEQITSTPEPLQNTQINNKQFFTNLLNN